LQKASQNGLPIWLMIYPATHPIEHAEEAMVTAGYSIEEDVLTARECDQLVDALWADGTRRSRAGLRHLMSNRAVAAVASDHRLLRLAQDALGAGAVPYRATLFEKSADANWLVVWHQDTALPIEVAFESPGWGPWSRKGGVSYAHAPAWALERIVALRLHLDASDSDNGPLRIVPGSHTAGVLTDQQVFALAAKERSIECTVGRGGVITMRPLLVHSSSKARSSDPRRVLHIEYADSLELAPGIRLAIA
jgi:ectoine hydroxylase-related dioxygenase (phytanoyl-CoA dioxygenase family)